LALDNIISSGSGAWDPIQNVGYTNHMKSDTYPAGANVLYFDGHVQFKAFAAGPNMNPVIQGQQVMLPMQDTNRWHFPKP
jgi:prepilin-type processing-associated H-X9-DG protein